MLLDEPLSALDLKLRQHMRAELRAIQKRTNVTFIYITHDQGEALAMSDRVGVMSQGRLQQVAVPQEIYNKPVNGFVASLRRREQHLCRQGRQRLRRHARSSRRSVGTFSATVGAGCAEAPSIQSSMSGPSTPGSCRKPVNGENAIAGRDRRRRLRGQFHQHPGARRGTAACSSPRCATTASGSVPAPGEKLHMVFDAERAVILADETPAASAAP